MARSELQSGLKRLTGLLNRNSKLVKEAALRAEDAMQIRDQYRAIKLELKLAQRHRSANGKSPG